MTRGNIDRRTVDGFGAEWAAYDQSSLTGHEFDELFQAYFSVFPFETLPPAAEGFDLGCGSGRWAAGVAPRIGTLHCIDPSEAALRVARKQLAHLDNVGFHRAGVDEIPLDDDSQDFGYSLGVLHHIPDTAAAMRDCVRKLKLGAPFLVYLYYSLDNRPRWFRLLWWLSNAARRLISRLPFRIRRAVTDSIAVGVYWPLARVARWADQRGANVSHWPLSAYRDRSFYMMRTDALDRFGTRLEQRFSRDQIDAMMGEAGLSGIRFREDVPFWTACGRRAA
jgi:SAM-dependent methyltransferase